MIRGAKKAAVHTATEARVLVFMPSEEATLACDLMAQAGLYALVCRDATTLGEVLREGAGAVLLAEAALSSDTLEVLAALDAQPHWSDLPLLLRLDPRGASAAHLSASETLSSRWNVFVLESSLSRTTLIEVVRLALQARRHQYRVRDLVAQLETLSKVGERVQERTVELHNSEARFSKVFYASPVPVTITTLSEGRYLDLNESALRLLGFRRDEVIGRTASELSRWIPETRGARDELLHKVQQEGSLHDVPIRFHTKAGELRDGLATFEVIELAGELCLLTMVLDVTGRRRNERELMQALQEVMSDTDWFSRSFVEKLAQVRSKGENPEHQAEVKDLTPREKEVLERVAQGYDNRQIAAELNLAKNTVRNYLANVFEKLNLHTRAEAVVWARKRGLGDDG